MNRDRRNKRIGWVPSVASALLAAGALVGLGFSMVAPEALTWGTPLAAVLCLSGAVLFVLSA